ncbi:MAG: transporter substrate-binding domain-containing protein [Burkholderiales bacterium]
MATGRPVRLATTVLAFLALVPALAWGADPPLRVVTMSAAPFVMPELSAAPEPPSGFSVDLWKEIARRMGVDSTWERMSTQDELLDAVSAGRADVAVAALPMTPEREDKVDFTYPYFDAGLRIMVRAQSEPSVAATLAAVPWASIGVLFAIALAIVFVLANLLWLIERRRGNPAVAKPYWRAIGESLWGTMLVIATGEHGDRDAPGAVKRLAVVAMWLIGVVLIAQLTATVTSSQTVQRLQSDIQGPEDLPGKSIGSVRGTVAGDYLAGRGLPFVQVKNGPEGLRMLAAGEVQAIVFEAPTLEYWAAREGGGLVQVVGPLFRPEKYAIAVANGSALRKKINAALLAVYADGTYAQIRAKWFGQAAGK